MTRAGMAVALVLGCAALISPGAAAGATGGTTAGVLTSNDSVFAGTTLSLKDGDKPEILSRVVLTGAIPLPGPNQEVTVTVSREGKPALTQNLVTNPATGRFRMPIKLTGCCEYVATAVHGTDVADPVRFEAQGPPELRPGKQTLLFNQLLSKAGYHMGEVSDEVNDSTGLAIHAMRKTNELEISEEYSPELFTLLMSGKGKFQPEHTEDGRHVEVDVSRQVMALVEDGKATDVFHVSTGAGGTPRGEWSFYQKSPGYNAKGMYYSSYYDGNYATHGYYSVPDYPASHGCTRNPEVYSVFIYNWIDLGDKMYVYD